MSTFIYSFIHLFIKLNISKLLISFNTNTPVFIKKENHVLSETRGNFKYYVIVRHLVPSPSNQGAD